MVRNYDIEVENLSDAERTPTRAGRVFPIVGFWGANLFVLAYIGLSLIHI